MNGRSTRDIQGACEALPLSDVKVERDRGLSPKYDGPEQIRCAYISEGSIRECQAVYTVSLIPVPRADHRVGDEFLPKYINNPVDNFVWQTQPLAVGVHYGVPEQTRGRSRRNKAFASSFRDTSGPNEKSRYT